jgi:hypothetical protein
LPLDPASNGLKAVHEGMRWNMVKSKAKRRSVAGGAFGLLCAGALLMGAAIATASAADESAITKAEWRTQKLEFTYLGLTAFYTCEGLESKVRYVLETFGARKDAKVRALGCDRAQNRPNKTAWVEAEFSSLAPATDSSKGDLVPAVWTKVTVEPDRPRDMGSGECELIDQMRPMLEKGFAMRNADYRAFCVPKQISVGDYSVNAEVLRPAKN